MGDFRDSSIKKFGVDIMNRKIELACSISCESKISNHRRAIDDPRFKKKYESIYNNKCGYCGVGDYILDVALFEIDHYIPKVSFQGQNKVEMNNIHNLVYSCKFCNCRKKEYLISSTNRELLHPDLNRISTVFIRRDDFAIEISSENKSNTEIECFFKLLKLYYQFRRLDYLLMELEDLKHYTKKQEVVNAISNIQMILRQKRGFLRRNE